MMQRIEADSATLMRQAPMTAALYLGEAVKQIDQVFGGGYAKKNPALVAAFLQTCALDFGACLLTGGLECLADALEPRERFTGTEG